MVNTYRKVLSEPLLSFHLQQASWEHTLFHMRRQYREGHPHDTKPFGWPGGYTGGGTDSIIYIMQGLTSHRLRDACIIYPPSRLQLSHCIPTSTTASTPQYNTLGRCGGASRSESHRRNMELVIILCGEILLSTSSIGSSCWSANVCVCERGTLLSKVRRETPGWSANVCVRECAPA